MKDSAFFELEFYSLIVTTFILPMVIYVYMLKKASISRYHVLGYGVILVFLSVLSAFSLSHLHDLSLVTASLADDKLFSSEVSVALYIVPAIFGGVGINIISHVLIDHLQVAERTFAESKKHQLYDI